MNKVDTFYTVDYISGSLSLRKPQEQSLLILEEVLNNIIFTKSSNYEENLSIIRRLYPTVSDFERDFMSLTFAIATGVGKTRLMGAFIAYLYTNYNIKNYFIVAPNITIFDKLKKDLGQPENPKYVFKGLGCFSTPPQVITDDDYKTRNINLFGSDVSLYIFNIDKFNSESSGMRKLNEVLGESFYSRLSALDDLVLIMDESHHYRAERGSISLNELNPLLGLELTATPIVQNGSKEIKFKNVVYEYPLSKAIQDGYTRTPYALTRSNVQFYNFGEEEIDKMMLNDAIKNHENIKKKLEAYAFNNNERLVKPFVLVVCKDTDHANWVENYIKSEEFVKGSYINKTVIVHSKQKGSESEANLRFLLEVENSDNPIEIVIHVNKLKEGWDVNNLYTIVPLRTAASKVLREQMVGRGLRLPYGKRVGDDMIDSVVLTAHDKFDDILLEAQRGDSIFKAGNVIKAEEIEDSKTIETQVAINFDEHEVLETAYRTTCLEKTSGNDKAILNVLDTIKKELQEPSVSFKTEKDKQQFNNKIIEKLYDDKDFGEVYKVNEDPFSHWISVQSEVIYNQIKERYIPIPRVIIKDNGVDEYKFLDFDLDISHFNHVPISNDMILQRLDTLSKQIIIEGDHIDFDSVNPHKEILSSLRAKPEVDYEECSQLLFKLINSAVNHYKSKYGENGMKNIVMMNRKSISDLIYKQMMDHFYYDNGSLIEEVISVSPTNRQQKHNYDTVKNLFEGFKGNIKAILFNGIKKGVFDSVKFDSEPELKLARILERDDFVKNWLRPAKYEFNITYNRGKQYEPDFVVETVDHIYLVEVKGEHMLNDLDVLVKKDRAIRFCEVVSNWNTLNNYKPWGYLFIPASEIYENITFAQLTNRFYEHNSKGVDKQNYEKN